MQAATSTTKIEDKSTHKAGKRQRRQKGGGSDYGRWSCGAVVDNRSLLVVRDQSILRRALVAELWCLGG